MKRFLSFFFCVMVVLPVLLINVNALWLEETSADIIQYEDGSYLVVTVEEIHARASGIKSGSKTYAYNSSSGELQWKAVLSGTFTYTGTTATCTAASCNVTISNSDWYVSSKTVSKSGNQALGELLMGKKLLGITVSSKEVYMALTCDANGNLS